MQIITLTTDWGDKDWYSGLIKGVLYNSIENLTIVDITHKINKFDIRSAAFVVKQACLNYPENTIHIVDVDSYEDENKQFVVVEYNRQFFICTDNGLADMIFDGLSVKITSMENMMSNSNYYTFAVLDLFTKVAKILATTHSTETIGIGRKKFDVISSMPKASIRTSSIDCQIIYIDDYGNAYLNIDDLTFSRALNGRNFEITVDVGCIITKISASYQDASVKTGKVLLTISSTRNLELALKGDNFAKLLGKQIGDKITIMMHKN